MTSSPVRQPAQDSLGVWAGKRRCLPLPGALQRKTPAPRRHHPSEQSDRGNWKIGIKNVPVGLGMKIEWELVKLNYKFLRTFENLKVLCSRNIYTVSDLTFTMAG